MSFDSVLDDQIKNKVHDPQTYQVIGAAIEVHSVLGKGFLESVYQEALAIELTKRKILFVEQEQINLSYKDKSLRSFFKADFVCFGNIIIELKALEKLTNNDSAQIINYLKATGFQRGLLLNFGNLKLEHKRFVLSEAMKGN